MMIEKHDIASPQILTIGDAAIEVLQSSDGGFRGLGAISIDGVVVRSNKFPLSIRLDAPEGIIYPRLEIEEISSTDSGATISLRAIGLRWGRGEYLDDYGQNIYWLPQEEEKIEDRLSIQLEPVQLDLEGKAFTGFSYAFHFQSSQRQIHRLLTQATWEIAGSITGNTILSQGQCNMPVYHGAKDSLFTSACRRTLEGYGSPQGNSFQLGARAALIQGFDFQYAKQGALLQYWPCFQSISSLIESPPNCDVLHLIDEYRFEMSDGVKTTPKHVLFAPGELEESQARDLWLACKNHIYGGIRERYNVTPTVVVPELYLHPKSVYDVEPSPDGTLRVSLAGVEVPHQELLYAIADNLLPRLAAQGIRRFFTNPGVTESDVTVLGNKRKLQDGLHGDLHCASVCGTHRFFPSEFWGGIEGWRYLYQKSQSLGIELGHWFAPHFSPRAPIYKEHPEYRMIDALGFPAGGGYGFETLVVADWNTGIFQVVLDDLKRWKEEAGLDYVFVDSYSNMGMLQTNYAAAMRTNFDAFSRLLSELQNIGISALSFECISPLGIGWFGITDLRGDSVEQNKAVAGQNDFAWWLGEEDMAIDCLIMVQARQRTAEEMQQAQFRFMANRSSICYQNLYDSSHILPEWWARANKVYNLALPHMRNRQLLPASAGVRWTDDTVEVLWLYKEYSLPDRKFNVIERLTENGFEEVSSEQRVLLPWQVYRLR